MPGNVFRNPGDGNLPSQDPGGAGYCTRLYHLGKRTRYPLEGNRGFPLQRALPGVLLHGKVKVMLYNPGRLFILHVLVEYSRLPGFPVRTARFRNGTLPHPGTTMGDLSGNGGNDFSGFSRVTRYCCNNPVPASEPWHPKTGFGWKYIHTKTGKMVSLEL